MKNKTAVLKQTARSYHIYRKKSTEGIEMKRLGKATGRTLLTALLAFAAALLAFFGVMFGIMPKDMYEVRAAGGEPVAIKAELQAGKDVYTGMTLADLANSMTVTLVDDAGDPVGDPLSYDMNGTSGFKLEGDISVDAGRLSQTQTFTVSYGAYPSVGLSVTVQYNRVKELTDVSFSPTETIYSNTDPSLMNIYLSATGVFYNGETTKISVGYLSFAEYFVPGTGYSGTDPTFSKTMTVRYTQNVNGTAETVEKELLVEDIHAVKPDSVAIQNVPALFDAYSKLAQYANEVTIRISYPQPDPDNFSYLSTIDVSLADVEYSNEKYGDANGKQEDSEGNPYTSFVYGQNGRGTLWITYTEVEPIESGRKIVNVARIETPVPAFSTNVIYDYTVGEDGLAVGTEQNLVPRQDFYADRMEITGITKEGVPSGEGTDYTYGASSVTITDAGTYEVTIELTNEAYQWQGVEGNERSVTVPLTVNKATLQDLALTMAGESLIGDGNGTLEKPYYWNHGESVPQYVLKGNYGAGKETPIYEVHLGGTVTDSAQMPTERGTYKLRVSVAETTNFIGNETSYIYFQIGQRELKLPSFMNAVYNGRAQFASDFLAEGSELWATYEKYCDIVGQTQTNADEYSVTFTIKDAQKNNAKWAEGSEDETARTVSFTIEKLRITKPTWNNESEVYSGSQFTWTLGNFSLIADGQNVSGLVPGALFNGALTVAQASGSAVFGTVGQDGTLKAKNAGKYSVTVALKDGNFLWEDSSFAELTLTHTVKRLGVTVTDPQNATYAHAASDHTSTADLTETGYNSAYMALSEASAALGFTQEGILTAVNAGTYTISVSLTSDNYCWGSGNEELSQDDRAAKQISWTIDRYQVEVPQVSGSYIYNASAQEVLFANEDGWRGVAYTVTAHESETAAGTYDVELQITDNYIWKLTEGTSADNQTVSWTIMRKAIAMPTADAVSFNPEGATTGTISGYVASDVFDSVMTTSSGTDGLTVDGAALSANAAGRYTIQISLSNNYVWGESAQAPGTNDHVTIEWEITRKEVDRPTLKDTVYTYNAQEQTVQLSAEIPYDNAYSFAEGSGTATDAGTYDVTFVLNDNYCWTGGGTENYTIEGKWVIGRFTIENPTEITYTGGLGEASNTYNYGDEITAAPVAITSTPDGKSYSVGGDTVKTSVNADGDYTLTLTLDNNYQWATEKDGTNVYVYTMSWNVLPLAIKLPEQPEGTDSFEYNSEKQTVQFTGWPSVKNSIYPLDFEVDSTAGKEYNQNTGEFWAKDADTYTIYVKLSDSVNFKWEDEVSATEHRQIGTVVITPLVLSVTGWTASEFTYSNERKEPTVTASNVYSDDTVTFNYSFSLQGGSAADPVNAGSYTVTITSLSGTDAGNYTLNGATGIAHDFTIKPFTLVTSEVVGDTFFKVSQTENPRYIEYNGAVQQPSVILNTPEGLHGVDISDVVGLNFESADSTNYGVYWFTLTLLNTDNYIWEVTPFTHPTEDDTSDSVSENVVWLWYQITKTLLDDGTVGFRFDGNAFWTYGSAAKTPVYNSGDYLQGMTYAIYYYGTPYDETYNGGWQSDTQEYAIQNKVTTAPTYAGEYYAVLVLTTSDESNYATYIKAIAFTIEAAEITLTFTGEQFIDGAYTSVYGTTQAATVTASGLQTPGGSGKPDTFNLLGVAYSYGETGSVMPKNVGEYTVTVTISNKNYALAETKAPFNITKATLTVCVEDETITYGEDAPAYTLVYSGWQYGENESADNVNASGVTYAYSGQGTSYRAGSDVGIYYVTPAGLTADNYDFTYLSTGTLTVKPKGITLTVKAGDKTYDGKAVSVSVTAPDKLDTDVINYVYTYTKDAAPMGAQSANYATNAGEWTVTVTLGEGGKSGNYVLTANGSAQFTIDKASLTIKFEKGVYTTIYGEQAPGYALTYSDWVNGEDFSGQLTPVFATKQGDTNYAPGATNGSVGAYNVTVTALNGSELLANYAYTDIKTLSATLTVEAREVSLKLGGLDGNTKVYDAQAVTISVTPSAQSGTTGLLAEDSLVYAYVYTWSGGAFAETTANCATDAGEWTVTVTLGTGEETGNYTLVGGNTYSFTITKAELTVKVSDSGATFYYGDTLDTSRYSAEITGWKSEADKKLLTVTRYTTQKDGKDYAPGAENGSVGKYTVTPILDKTELTNYTWTIVTATLTVEERPVTVTVTDVEKTYGDTDISLDLVYKAAGLSGNYSADSIKGIISFTCETDLSSKTKANAAGYTVTAEAINANYAVTFAGGDMQALFKIDPAQMTNVNVTGYAGTYDSEAHEAAQEREVTLLNDELNGGSVQWYFRLADGKWSQSLTLENAGTYTVYYYVTADNHAVYGDQTQSGTTEYSFTVTIDKYALSIRADATTTYGEAFDKVKGYTLSYKYGEGDWTQDRPFGESLTEMGLGGEGAAFKLAVSSVYSVGDNAGAYTITLSGAYEGNYDLTLSDGTLTVKARAITVTIDDKTGTSGSTYGNAFNALTASVTEGKIYETDGVATVYDLITLAVYNKGKPIPSQNEGATDVGYYLIVGTYAADSPFDVPVEQNYTITFKGSQDFGDGTQNAGRYQVNPKNVGIKLALDKGVEEDSEYLTYDGTQKGYTASFAGEEIDGITFVYHYKGTTVDYGSEDRPTKAGSYTVTVTASSENYNFTDASTDFTISKATYTADNSLNVLSLFGDTDYTASVDGVPLYAYLYLYDGKVHRPDAIESYLNGLAQEAPADRSFPSIVSITEGKVNRYDDGDNTVTIGSETHYYKLIEVTFKAGSDNYQAPASMKFIVVIRALEVEVAWGETEYTYDGTNQIGKVQPVYYILNDRGQSAVSLALSDKREFRAADDYSFTAVFTEGDNANQNYVLKTSGENSHTQLFTMRQREVNIAISDDSMQYGDATPAASTEQSVWWNYADDNAYTLVEGDQIVITVSAMTAAQGGQAVTSQTNAGEYFLVAVASSKKDVLGNYVITFTGSRGENGQFTVKKRAITVNIGDVSSVYGNAQAALAAALAEGSALSAASKDAGPNGETLTGGEKPVIALATSVSITTSTPVGRYVVYGTRLESGNYSVTFTGNADYEGTGNAGEYTVTEADFTEEDFTFAGYGGADTFYDAKAHRALDSYELTNELSAAYLNGLTLEYFVTKDAEDTQNGTPVEEFMVTHVSESGTYYFYVVAKTSDGIECYERKTFAFTVDINTAANKVTQEYLWSNLEYGVTADDKNITPIGVRFGSAELAGFYQGGELVASTQEEFAQKIAARSIGAGDYTVRFTVAGSLYDGAYDYGDADGDTFECTVNVAKYTVTLVWSGGNSLMYSGSEQLNTLQISDPRIEGEHWMANAFTTYFAYITNAGGGSLSYAATGYPQITATQAGGYSITLSLTDAENYRWADMEDGTEKTFTFNISAEANSITVTIRDGGWTYGDTDGLAQEAIIGEEDSAEDLFISFTVTAPGTYVYLFKSTDGKYRSSTVPTDAGEYTVTVTVLATTSYGEASDTKTFTITPKKIAVPYFENSSTDYNGLEQRNRVVSYQSGITWVSGLTIGTDSGGIYAVATNAGDYTGTLTIINANYVWNDETGGTGEREIVWTIAKGVPQFEGTLTLANNSWTYGEEKTASPSGVTAGFAGNAGVLSVVYKYFRDAQLVQECDVIPTDAGTYYVAAYVAGDGVNYVDAWLMADGQRVSVSFTIAKAAGDSLDVTVGVTNNVYGEVPVITIEGLAEGEYTVVYSGTSNDGTWNETQSASAPTLAGSYTVTVKFTGNQNYQAADFEESFEIARASFTSAVEIEGWTYGEEGAQPSVTANPGTGSVTYTYGGASNDGSWTSADGKPTLAGNYTVYAEIGETANYAAYRTEAVAFTIARANVTLSVHIADWTYSQAASVPEVSGYGEAEQTVDYLYNAVTVYDGTPWTNQKEAPESAGYYSLTASVKQSANYQAATETVYFYILRASYTLSLTLDGWTYGRAANSPVCAVSGGVSALPEDAQITYYYEGTSNDGTWSAEEGKPAVAGSYRVHGVTTQTANYASVTSESVSFTIERADYDLSGLVFDLADWTQTEGVYSYVYDGKAHAPEIAALPNGLDGIGLKVAYSGEVTDVSDGTVTRTATFSTESGNYNTPAAVSVEICIAAREVSVVWEQTHYTYNGKVQQVSAYFLDVNEGRQTLTVNIADGAFMDYREEGYQATAVCTDANYRLSGASQTLFIDRLAVTVTIDNAQATYGDEDIASPALSARENVVLPDDAALVYTLYIEGLGEKVNAGTYAICGRAEGERAHNYSLTFTNGVYTVARRQVTVNIDAGGGTYGETITPASIVSVSALANGDTRETALDPFFVWTYSGTAFDGTTSYRGSIVPTLAGNYSVTLTLAQSAEDMTCNYTMTAVLDGFTVARKIVEVPVLDGFFYNGTEQSVQTQAEQALEALNAAYDGVVSLAEENVYTAEHAGDYVVTFRLADTANYRWNTLSEGTADAQVAWQIRQAQASDGLVVSIPTLAGWVYDNTAKTPVGSVLTIGGETIDDAQIVYVYSSKRSELPADHHFEPYTDAGTYYVRAYVAGTDDYAQIYSEPLEYTISQAEYDLSGLSFAGETHVFNGADYVIALSGTLPVGLDGIGVTAEYTLDGQNSATPFPLRNAGEYEITVTLHSASKNYVSPDWTRTAELIIQARTVNVHWDKTQFTYNGSEQTVTAYYIDVNDAHCELAVTIGEGKTFRDVGEYSATASFVTPDANYALRETQTLLTMLSASIVVRILPQEFFYSGSMPELDQSAYRIETQGEFTNLNITLSAADSTGDWNAGTYAISASWENDNYAIEFVGGTLEILPAVVEVGITLHENLTYDGTAKTATAQILSGVVAGETLSISLVYSGTANNGSTWYSTEAPVFAGSYSVRAVISSQNYSLDSQATATAFTIARAVVALPAIDSDDTPLTVSTEKTGEEQRILIPIDLRLVGVLEAVAGTGLVPGADGSILLQAMEEGTYGVTLYLRDADNYAWSNGSTDNLSLEWTIVQNGLDPIFWVMIALGAALLIELIVLAAYFLSGGANGGKGGDDDTNDDANNDGNDDGNNDGEETPSDDVRGGADSAPAPQQSGKTVTASVAAPVLFGLLAITEWQIAGVALLAAAVAAFLVIDIVLYSRRAAKNKTEETETVSASRKEPVEEAPEEVPAPEEEPVEETPEENAELAVAVVAEEPEEEEDEEDEEDEEPEDENVGSIESNVTVIDGRKILVRYNYSFRAKLIQSGEETQERFGQLMDEFSSYPQVKTRESWRQVRVYSGRKTLACVLFKGRKLCVAFALDPKQYEETKYRGKDMSEIKRYEKTPMLLKVFSERKLSYAKYLFAQVAAQYGLRQEEVEHHSFRLPYQTTEELIEEKLVKLYSNKELSEDAQIVKADIATLIREKISMREAQSALSDEVAAMYLEEEEMPQPQPEQVQEPDAETQPMQTPSEPVPVKEAAEERKVRVKRGIINIDTLSRNFQPNEVVTLEVVRARKLVAKDVDYLKVLARGYIDKPLIVEAHDFSMDAVKMILLTGGRAIRKKK